MAARMGIATYYLLRGGAEFVRACELVENYLAETPQGSFNVFDGVTRGSAQGVRVRAFVRNRVLRRPGWVQFIEQMVDADLGPAGGTSLDCIVVMEHKHRVWVLSMGTLYSAVWHLPIERRFGVVAACNASSPDEVRQIAAHTHGAAAMYRLERRGRRGDLTEFLVSRLARRTSRIAAKVIREVDRPCIVQGSLGLQYRLPASLAELRSVLDQLYRWWNGGDHKHDGLRNLDKVRDAEDEEKIATHDALLEKMIMRHDSGVSLWCDADEFYDLIDLRVEYQCRTGTRPDGSPRWSRWTGLNVDLDVQSLMRRYADIHGHPGCDPRRRARVVGRNADGKDLSRPLIHMFSAEVDESEGEVWVYEEGGWFIVNRSHRDSIDAEVRDIAAHSGSVATRLSVNLPGFDHASELEYNKEVVQANLDKTATLLDEASARLPYHGSTVEIGDVFVPRPEPLMMAVKRGTTFAPVSRVCEQAGRAAELLAADRDFREAVEAILSERIGKSIEVRNNGTVYWAIVLVMRDTARFPSALGYRARECIYDYIIRVRSFGFQPLVLAVPGDAA